jgi:hypothetical protein
MNTFDDAVKECKTLSKLDRITGSYGQEDYFVILDTPIAQYSLKVDFIKNFLGQPTGFFARVRITKGKEQDITSMSKLYREGKLGDQTKLEKALDTKAIGAKYFKYDTKRISYVFESDKNLNDYGDPSTKDGHAALIKILSEDLSKIGNRVFLSLKKFFPDAKEREKKLIQDCMSDYVQMFKPIEPKAGSKAKVTPIKKAAVKKK